MTTDTRNRSTDVIADPPPVQLNQVTRRQGAKGISIWGGHVREEFIPDLLSWPKKVRTFLEMRQDPTIATLLNAIKLPLLAADFDVEAGEGKNAEAKARFLRENLTNMHRQSWRKFVQESLDYLDFGFGVHEIILEKRADGHLWLRNLEPRGQETLRRWGLAEDGETATHMIQGGFRGPLASTGEGTAVNLEKTIHFTHGGRKGNPQGESFLRPLWTAYRFTKNLRVEEGIGIERDASGMPVFTLPEGGVAAISNDFTIEDLQEQLAGIKNDEEQYFIKPEGTTLETFGSHTKAYNVRETITAWEKIILMYGFAQFLALGMDNVGTQSLVEGSQDFFTLLLEAIQNEYVETVNQQMVPFLFRYNPSFGHGDLPRIVWGKPGKVDIKTLLEAYSAGTGSKVLTPTREDEVRIREALDLPELADDQGHEDRTAPDPADNPLAALGFAEADGQDLRTIPGVYERFANRYQRDLVDVFDAWSEETARLAALPGRSTADLRSMFEGRLEGLGADLRLLGRERIAEASGLGLGGPLGQHAQKPEVQSVIARLIREHEEYVDTALIPSIRQRFGDDLATIGNLPAEQRSGSLLQSMAKRRSRVAQGAGGAVTAIFEPQVAAGKLENAERRANGEAAIPVRWVLDDRAEHCADDTRRGTFGCPNLARVYDDGWDSMVTVPAGNVSCLGNCRCYLEADFGSGFERIT